MPSDKSKFAVVCQSRLIHFQICSLIIFQSHFSRQNRRTLTGLFNTRNFLSVQSLRIVLCQKFGMHEHASISSSCGCIEVLLEDTWVVNGAPRTSPVKQRRPEKIGPVRSCFRRNRTPTKVVISFLFRNGRSPV